MQNLQFEKLSLLLKKNKQISLRVISKSMQPLLQIGDEITVVPCDPCNLKKWDIVTFRQDSKIIVHIFWRYSHLTHNAIITRPLNCFSNIDDTVVFADVLGKVSSHSITKYLIFTSLIKNLFNLS